MILCKLLVALETRKLNNTKLCSWFWFFRWKNCLSAKLHVEYLATSSVSTAVCRSIWIFFVVIYCERKIIKSFSRLFLSDWFANCKNSKNICSKWSFGLVECSFDNPAGLFFWFLKVFKNGFRLKMFPWTRRNCFILLNSRTKYNFIFSNKNAQNILLDTWKWVLRKPYFV